MGICANLKAEFPSCTDGWWMLRARPGQMDYEHETHEIVEEKIAPDTAAEFGFLLCRIEGQWLRSLGLNFLTHCVT